MARETQNYYDIVKLCKGGLVLNLPSHDSTVLSRRIEFAHNVDKIRVPRTHALGIFIDGTLERMYKEGYFKVEPEASFNAEIEEIFFPIQGVAETFDDEVVTKALMSGNRMKIKEIIGTSAVNRDKVLKISKEIQADLSVAMIKDLEKIFGVELMVDDAE